MNVETVKRMLKLAHQTCTVVRYTPGPVDPYDQEAPGTWDIAQTDVRCAAFVFADVGEQTTPERAIIHYRRIVYFAGDVDVVESDRLDDLTFKGEVVNTHQFEIVQLLRQEPYYIQAFVRELL